MRQPQPSTEQEAQAALWVAHLLSVEGDAWAYGLHAESARQGAPSDEERKLAGLAYCESTRIAERALRPVPAGLRDAAWEVALDAFVP